MNYGKLCEDVENILKIEDSKGTKDDKIISILEEEVYGQLDINKNDISSFKNYILYDTVKFLDRNEVKIKDSTMLKNLILKEMSNNIIEHSVEEADRNKIFMYITLNEYYKNPNKLIDSIINFKYIMKPKKT